MITFTDHNGNEMKMHIIVSASDEKCLYKLETILGYEDVYVYRGHTSQLQMKLEKWNSLDEPTQDYIIDFTQGFVSGWECARE